MKASTLFLSTSKYFILNKDLMKHIGLEPTVLLCSLINIEESKNVNKKISYFETKISQLAIETTLSNFKIKNAINKLYKTQFIEVVVKKNEQISIKILHDKIVHFMAKVDNKEQVNNTVNKKVKIKNYRFKKPTLKELKKYFLELGINTEESEIMFDYYESKGWKVGKAPMKCWKSATRNWARRINKKLDFPDYYDKTLETQICNDPTALSKYHNHLKKLGWESIYSPSAGTTWRKRKI
tara:strand:- start:2462 stop:3178 length:717 start_codon:yes stop_codon:yes gene_type:complete